ncbi:Na(+)/H(+) antiporter subunit B [Nannocystaceae bacterium ST9]
MSEPSNPDMRELADQTLIRVVAKLAIPFILLLGFYIILHGELGPGGGFQGGVVVAAGLILYGLVFGADELRKRVPVVVLDSCMALGALIYAGTGLASLLAGGTFLDYGMLMPHSAGDGEALGLTLVEYGVGITVSSVMTTIYLMISERRSTLRAGEEKL